MKFCIAVVTSLLFFSCSKAPLEESIVGTWELKSMETKGCGGNWVEHITPFVESADQNYFFAEFGNICNVFYSFQSNGIATLTVIRGSEASVDDFAFTPSGEVGLAGATSEATNTVAICQSVNDCTVVEVIDLSYITNEENSTVLLCNSSDDCLTAKVEGEKLILTPEYDLCSIEIMYEKGKIQNDR